MSSETFATAIFLITAIIAAAVLINAFFPIIYQASSTFSESSQSADERLRTDITIINSFASTTTDPPNSKIWIKNTGSVRIAKSDLNSSDVFFGPEGDFEYLSLDLSGTLNDGEWTYQVLEDTPNDYWDTRETMMISLNSAEPLTEEQYVYFQLVLPSGVSVSKTFTTSG